MSETSPSPLAWRLCGNQLKLWRMGANISREELGREAGYEVDTIKSMEQGRRRPSQRLLDIADEMFGAHGKLRAAHPYLEPERFASRSREYMVIEAEAIALHWYDVLFIPGLLQTEEYARVLMSSPCPPADEETIQKRVAARLERQELLKKQTVMFNFVIHEVALRSMVGGSEVMKNQLNHLVKVGDLPNVFVQVLPMGLGVHPGLGGPFTVLETSDHAHYGYQEAQAASMMNADPERVSKLMKRFGVIRMHALSAVDSVPFIKKVAEEL